MIIKNFKSLIKKSLQRKKYLLIIENALKILRPKSIVKNNIIIRNNKLKIGKKIYNLSNFENIYLLGIGKGSLSVSVEILKRVKKIREAYIIDLNQPKFFYKNPRINFYKGTHPLPSINNLKFSKKIIQRFYNKTREEDLFIVVICGGGSAMLTYPFMPFEELNKKNVRNIELNNINKYINLNQQLLKSGANIYEMNIIRKHCDVLKGGGLAKLLYPANVISLIISDVPGNDLSIIASGPTVKDKSTIEDAFKLIKKFKLKNIKYNDLIETTKDYKYFKKVNNIILLNNLMVLKFMKEQAKYWNLKSNILTDRLKGNVIEVARLLIKKIEKSNNILLLGGETTVVVKGNGLGGRNQELVLWFLKDIYHLKKYNLGIISINSDGWDNTFFAGAIGDMFTLEEARKLNLNIDEFLKNNDSYNFFKKVNDGIFTGRLPINISDIILVFKY
ncbi:MAG: D-glycerate 2-kinase [Candidatus Parcubacteria bacterium]|nr:MAG: D-glycerate 2-kinase [Candidatus Parcubacteria bacterium]